MSRDEYQTRHLTVIGNMLTSAATESIHLFEMMLNELKEEISTLQKENEDLKAKCSYLEFLTTQPKPDIHGIDSEKCPSTAATCDIGVQCDSVSPLVKAEHVTILQQSLDIVDESEDPIQFPEDIPFLVRGASCDLNVNRAEIGVDSQTKSPAEIPVPFPTDIRNCSLIISAATPRRGQPTKEASLFGIHTQPEPEISPMMGGPCSMRSCHVTLMRLHRTVTPPPSSDIPPAKKLLTKASKHVQLDSCVPWSADSTSLNIGRLSEDVELSGSHQVLKEMDRNGGPSAAEVLEESESIGPRTLGHNPELNEALLCAKDPQTLDKDEDLPDNASELHAESLKYNANKQIPCALKGFRLSPNKLSPSAQKCRLNQDKCRPKGLLSQVNNACTSTIITTKAVWTPPILEAGKSPLGNDNRLDRIPTKRTTRYPIPKQHTSSHSVTKKHQPPFMSVSRSKGRSSARRTMRYSHLGTTCPKPAKTSSLPSPSVGEAIREQCGCLHDSLHVCQRPFSCTLCGQRFPDPKALSRHGRVHHDGKIFICPQCNEGFAYRFGLAQHLQKVHSRLKPFVCNICLKSFLSRTDHERHLRVHSKARQFPCKLCDKRFNRSVELHVHLRSHTRENRYWCQICGRGFLDSNNLKRHNYTHTGERPYSCSHCIKSFVQSGHLKRHLRNIHMVDVYADSQ